MSSNRLQAGLENLHLYRRLYRHGAGTIHVHSPFVYGAARLFIAASRLKSVLHIHLAFSAEQLKWSLRAPPDLIVVCADFMRPAVEQALPPTRAVRTEVRVILNAVDTERFFPADRVAAKARVGVRTDVPLLMMAANLAPHKGQETAVRAVAALKERGHDVRLWLVGEERGDGLGFLGRLKALVRELGVEDRVDFLGFRNDIPELLRAADFVLLPSTNEGLPLVILEAQASKALVLAAPTAGIPEIIEDGCTGYLIRADDYRGYADRIAFLLTNPSAAATLIESAYRRVRERHHMKRYCSRVLDEYDRLLERGR
jgi:glycosyltransferase involved in cell wall biosynthesis